MFLTETTEHTEREEKEQSIGFIRLRRIKPISFSVPSVRSVRDLRFAFTLIELLIVMLVIAILVGITIPVSKYVTYRARAANQQIEIEKIKSALEDYRAAYGEYPITPMAINPATGQPTNYADVVRHYPDHYATECYYTSNSPYTNIDLATNNVEWISTDKGYSRGIDYALTYPLMLRQRAEGARPFMDFKEVTVAYLVYKQVGATFQVTRRRRLGGVVDEIMKEGAYGNPVNRPKAIDPVSQRQWKYVSENGVTYSLTTNSF